MLGRMSETGIVPDTKDWTWVLREACPECGYDATTVDRADLGARIRASAAPWAAALARPDAADRPEPGTWSPLEYACHVRDVHRIFGVRLASMIEEDNPRFANWDQDDTAVDDAYGEQDPATVADDLLAAATAVAAQYDSVADDEWGRPGVRSDGSEFTVETLGRYHLHDAAHHVWDVVRGP